MSKFLFVAAICGLAALLTSQPTPREQVGPLPNGAFLLNSGWSLQPAGRQIPLDTLPMAAVLSPDRKYVVVLNGGYNPPSLVAFEAATMRQISSAPVLDAWLGLAFSPDGKFLYTGGGSQAAVFEFAFDQGRIAAARSFPIVPPESRKPEDFIGDVALSPDGRLIYAADLFHDTIHVINPQSGRVIEHWPTGRRPYRILFHPDGKSYFVSSWVDGTVNHHSSVNGEVLSKLRVGAHPTDLLWRESTAAERAGEERAQWKYRLFVTASNTNSVYSVGVSESGELRLLESINVALTPRQPAGMTPSALAMNAERTQLYVACSDANAVAVVDISLARSGVVGFIPTGWYPTALRMLPNQNLLVLNGRGLRSFPNPQGPNPTQRPAPVHVAPDVPSRQYVGNLQRGSASLIEPFSEQQLESYTRTVAMNSPYRDAKLTDAGSPAGNPVPTRPGLPSPVTNVVYILKENRTYDQVLGDLDKGNGDRSLTLFGEEITPNHHKLAREFVLFDNFYVNADVSADGHNWSAAAIANDYVQKMWPNSYAKRRQRYDYEGGEPATYPPAGYLWTNAAAAGVPFRNYGWFVTNEAAAAKAGERQVAAVRDPVLSRSTNLKYRGFDLQYPDTERAKVFLEDLAEFEKTGSMPRLILIRIGNDHTSGTAAGRIAPRSAVADNDLALGMIVEGLSKSRFWNQTAVFVLEDDAQNGPDHVDSHRSPVFVLSPYTRRGIVDSTMYNTASVLRTIELLLGLRPMTHFDAGARPMSAAFAGQPDSRPYAAEKARIPLDERNPAQTASAARSAHLDLDEADRIDDDEMNDILWRAVRGTEPPVPVRSFFSR